MSRSSVVDNWISDTQCRRVLLIYSAGFHFERAARAIKDAAPASELTAAVPPSMEERARTCEDVDKVLLTEREGYGGIGGLRHALRHVLALRRDRYDMAVVMFRSMKLAVVLYCMRAGVTALADASGGLERWHVSPVRALAAVPVWFLKRILGCAVYGTIRLIVGLWRAVSSC
jgi:hypothetical protein